MTNAQIASLFLEMAALLELQGADPFRIRAYQRAAQVLASHGQPVAALTSRQILEIPGVGTSMADHIARCLSDGCFPELARLRRRFPPGLRELLNVPGLGAKRARFLFESAGISSRRELKAALAAGGIRGLPGFGSKLEANLLRNLAFSEQPKRMLWWHAKRLVAPLLAELKGWVEVSAAETAGSLRRGRETVGDVDLVCASRDGAAVVDRFVKLGGVEQVLAAGATKASVRLSGGMQCDLRVVPQDCFGAALQYFTGSKDHNVALRELAVRGGLTLNEYGLFRASDKKLKKPLAGRSEREIYERLGLAYIEPELRENAGEIEAAAAGRLPRLIAMDDIRGDFHNHSTHTDGKNSLAEMARGAAERGWEWVALGDHSRSLRIAHGLDVPRLRRTFKEVETIRKKVPGIALLRSMEVDILEDGRMDYPDDVLDEIDVVIGSVHSRFKQPRDEMTLRLSRAASNPRVDILGHVSGRLINRRQAYPFDAEEVMRAAAEAGTAVEINGQPDRQDLDAVGARRAKTLGVKLAVSTDAHSLGEYAFMAMAVTVARRAWLEPQDVLNCLSLEDLRRWLDLH